MPVATLEKVHRARPDVEIVLFGERIAGLSLPFPYQGVGVVTDQEKLARLYSRADLHFDGSEFQAFGKAGLEAVHRAVGIGRRDLVVEGTEDCALRADEHPQFRQAIESQIPIGRVAEAEEIAEAIGILASGRLAYMTGNALVMDGGWTAI